MKSKLIFLFMHLFDLFVERDCILIEMQPMGVTQND